LYGVELLTAAMSWKVIVQQPPTVGQEAGQEAAAEKKRQRVAARQAKQQQTLADPGVANQTSEESSRGYKQEQMGRQKRKESG